MIARRILFAIVLISLSSACATARLAPHSTGIETVLNSTRQIAYELDEEDQAFDDPFDAPEDLADSIRPEVVRLVFRWPLEQVRVTSRFGRRGLRPHQGVDLRASYGTPVVAALGGVVVYADDRISGYGETLILRHPRGVSTIYAHCSKLLVRVGDRVIGGQRIALSGDSGRATAPHLHFEVRDGMRPLDPQQAIRRGKARVRLLETELEEDTAPADGGAGALTE